MACAVGRNVFAQGVQVVSAAFVVAFDAAFDSGKDFVEFSVRVHGRINEGFGFQDNATRVLQKTERKSRDDSEAVMNVQSAPQERDGATMRHAILPLQMRAEQETLKPTDK